MGGQVTELRGQFLGRRIGSLALLLQRLPRVPRACGLRIVTSDRIDLAASPCRRSDTPRHSIGPGLRTTESPLFEPLLILLAGSCLPAGCVGQKGEPTSLRLAETGYYSMSGK